MKIKSKSSFSMFFLLIAIGLFAHFEAHGQNDYFPATVSEPVVLDHIVKAKYLPGDGYEPESRRMYKVGTTPFLIRIKQSGGYWYISVYPGFIATVKIKNPRGNVATQTTVYGGKQKLDVRFKLWEVTGVLEGEITVEKDTRPITLVPKIEEQVLIKTKPFPKADLRPKAKPRVSRPLVIN